MSSTNTQTLAPPHATTSASMRRKPSALLHRISTALLRPHPAAGTGAPSSATSPSTSSPLARTSGSSSGAGQGQTAATAAAHDSNSSNNNNNNNNNDFAMRRDAALRARGLIPPGERDLSAQERARDRRLSVVVPLAPVLLDEQGETEAGRIREEWLRKRLKQEQEQGMREEEEEVRRSAESNKEEGSLREAGASLEGVREEEEEEEAREEGDEKEKSKKAEVEAEAPPAVAPVPAITTTADDDTTSAPAPASEALSTPYTEHEHPDPASIPIPPSPLTATTPAIPAPLHTLPPRRLAPSVDLGQPPATPRSPTIIHHAHVAQSAVVEHTSPISAPQELSSDYHDCLPDISPSSPALEEKEAGLVPVPDSDGGESMTGEVKDGVTSETAEVTEAQQAPQPVSSPSMATFKFPLAPPPAVLSTTSGAHTSTSPSPSSSNTATPAPVLTSEKAGIYQQQQQQEAENPRNEVVPAPAMSVPTATTTAAPTTTTTTAAPATTTTLATPAPPALPTPAEMEKEIKEAKSSAFLPRIRSWSFLRRKAAATAGASLLAASANVVGGGDAPKPAAAPMPAPAPAPAVITAESNPSRASTSADVVRADVTAPSTATAPLSPLSSSSSAAGPVDETPVPPPAIRAPPPTLKVSVSLPVLSSRVIIVTEHGELDEQPGEDEAKNEGAVVEGGEREDAQEQEGEKEEERKRSEEEEQRQEAEEEQRQEAEEAHDSFDMPPIPNALVQQAEEAAAAAAAAAAVSAPSSPRPETTKKQRRLSLFSLRRRSTAPATPESGSRNGKKGSSNNNKSTNKRGFDASKLPPSPSLAVTFATSPTAAQFPNAPGGGGLLMPTSASVPTSPTQLTMPAAKGNNNAGLQPPQSTTGQKLARSASAMLLPHRGSVMMLRGRNSGEKTLATNIAESSSSESESSEGAATRQALNVTVHSHGTIALGVKGIEDEESRRLSEMAFLC